MVGGDGRRVIVVTGGGLEDTGGGGLKGSNDVDVMEVMLELRGEGAEGVALTEGVEDWTGLVRVRRLIVRVGCEGAGGVWGRGDGDLTSGKSSIDISRSDMVPC